MRNVISVLSVMWEECDKCSSVMCEECDKCTWCDVGGV